MDVLFLLLSAAVLVFSATRFAGDGRGWVFDAVADAAVCLTVPARRRYPVAAPVAGLAVSAVAAVVAMIAGLPSEPGAAAILALMMLAFTAVRSLPSVPATAIGLCGVFVTGVGRLGSIVGYQTSNAAYRVGTEGWLIAVAIGLWLRYLDRRRHDTAEAVRRDERLAMARELHDVVAHHITGIVLQTQAARITARRDRPSDIGGGAGERGDFDGGDLDDALAEIEVAGSEALAAMRRVVSLLRDTDDAVTTGTGPEHLTKLVERFGGHGPAVTLRLPERDEAQWAQWPPEIASTVYRVVQESLTNIARHAVHARSASVEITREAEAIRVAVTDDAPAAATGPLHLHRAGFGLVGMRERVEALGGTLDAGPRSAGLGWAVTATLPVTSTTGDDR